MNLLQLSDAYEVLFHRAVDTETGEVRPEFEAELQAAEDSLHSKALAVAKWALGLETEAEAVNVHVQRLGRRRDSLKRQARWARDWIVMNLPEGMSPKDDRVRIGWQNRTVLEPHPEVAPETLPLEFQRVEVSLDLKRIAQALKDPADPLHADAQRVGQMVSRRSLVLR